MQTCDKMILECYWFGIKYECTELFAERPTDNGFCCSFNTLPMSLQLLVFSKYLFSFTLVNTNFSSKNSDEYDVGQKNLYKDRCDEWLDLINMKLTSPNYPDPYDSLTDCKWNLTADPGKYITLNFERIDVREIADKRYDRIT